MSEVGVTVATTMVAVAWAAIGILAATLLGSLYYLGSRIDGLSLRIDGLETGLGTRIDGLDAKLGGRIDALASRLDNRIDGLSGRIDALSGRIDAHLERHAG
jgi:hypothetical protein